MNDVGRLSERYIVAEEVMSFVICKSSKSTKSSTENCCMKKYYSSVVKKKDSIQTYKPHINSSKYGSRMMCPRQINKSHHNSEAKQRKISLTSINRVTQNKSCGLNSL